MEALRGRKTMKKYSKFFITLAAVAIVGKLFLSTSYYPQGTSYIPTGKPYQSTITLTGKLDTAWVAYPNFGTSDSTAAFPIETAEYFTFGIGKMDTTNGNSIGKLPSLHVDWYLKNASNGLYIIDGETSPYIQMTDSVKYGIDYGELFTITPPVNKLLGIRIYFSDNVTTDISTSRSVSFPIEFQPVQR